MEIEGGYGNQLAYDLRQRYAKIVGDHLEDVADARKAKNYPDYFSALEDLYVIVKHRFKPKKNKKKEVNKNKTKKKNYNSLRSALCALANKYQTAWAGTSKSAEEIGEIETALREIEMFLYAKMNDAGMFGTKRESEGLI